MTDDLGQKNCRRLVDCAGLNEGACLIVLSDPTCVEVAELVTARCREFYHTEPVRLIASGTADAARLLAETAENYTAGPTVFALTEGSLAHTGGAAAVLRNGGRYLSLAGYSTEVLAAPAMSIDFRALGSTAVRLAGILDEAEHLSIWSKYGTSLSVSVAGRRANMAPGFCSGPGSFASPPDAEVNIAPVETSVWGRIAVNGRVLAADIGLLDEPLFLNFVHGTFGEAWGEKAEAWRRTTQGLRRVVGEIGIGLNPVARLDAGPLEAEGVAGNVHIGMGSNEILGGAVGAGPHLDHVLLGCSITADGRMFLDDGMFCEEDER